MNHTRQIVGDIRQRIDDGTYPPGTRIPSYSGLATAYGVSVATARRAVGLLREAGVVTGRQGHGVFVGQAPAAGDQGTAELERRIADLAKENTELDALFQLQWRRTNEATARWRAEDPVARALTMPDFGDLLRWLMEQVDNLRAASRPRVVSVADIPEPIIALLDARAGREHSRDGTVAVTLAEILTLWEKLRRGGAAMGNLFGPHCEHDECAMTSCDQVTDGAGILFGCRSQATCPHCGPATPAWPRLARQWVDWATEAYGTADSGRLRAAATVQANVVATAELVETHPVPDAPVPVA